MAPCEVLVATRKRVSAFRICSGRTDIDYGTFSDVLDPADPVDKMILCNLPVQMQNMGFEFFDDVIGMQPPFFDPDHADTLFFRGICLPDIIKGKVIKKIQTAIFSHIHEPPFCSALYHQ